MSFDPEAAKDLYSRNEPEELVRIALLESDYLPQARRLAEQELEKRGISDTDRHLIVERLKKEMEDDEIERWGQPPMVY
jgi:hypothetical protein